MVMTPGFILFAFNQKFARHPEMQPKARLLENKTHLFPLGLDAGEFLPFQSAPDVRRRRRPKNPRPLPTNHPYHPVANPRRPLLGIKSHLRKFRHASIILPFLNTEN